jgi:hypothetical protein
MAQTEHDKHVAGAGDDKVRKGHPSLDDKQSQPDRTRDGSDRRSTEGPPSKPTREADASS